MTQHYDWGYGGDSYAGGRFTYATSSPPSGPWTTGSTADLAFKTYVAQPQAATVPKKKKKCKRHKAPRGFRKKALQEEEALAPRLA